MEQNPVWSIGRILRVGGLALLVGVVGLGSLAVVWAAPGGTAAAQIGVQACPANLAIAFTPADPDPGETVEFEAQFTTSGGTGQITFTWNFGDQSAEMTGQVVNHSYTLNGLYQVTLTAAGDTCASQPAPVTRLITVGFGPPAAVIYVPLVFKNYIPVIFPTGGQPIESAPTGIPNQN